MPQRFCNITLDQMEAFMADRGFVRMYLDGTTEVVFGKVVRLDGTTFSIRVYTAIWPSGESRDRGKDAIRVQLYVRYKGVPTMIGDSRVVKRIQSWRKNLNNAINEWRDQYERCPACGNPMVFRDGKYGPFLGCIAYHDTGCTGRPQVGNVGQTA